MSNNSIVLLSMRQVQLLLGIRSRSTIYAMIARGELPAPCVVGRRGLRWREDDIRKTVDSLPSWQKFSPSVRLSRL